MQFCGVKCTHAVECTTIHLQNILFFPYWNSIPVTSNSPGFSPPALATTTLHSVREFGLLFTFQLFVPFDLKLDSWSSISFYRQLCAAFLLVLVLYPLCQSVCFDWGVYCSAVISYHGLGNLNNKKIFSQILEAGSLRVRCWQGWFLWGLSPWLGEGSVLPVSLYGLPLLCVLIPFWGRQWFWTRAHLP